MAFGASLAISLGQECLLPRNRGNCDGVSLTQDTPLLSAGLPERFYRCALPLPLSPARRRDKGYSLRNSRESFRNERNSDAERGRDKENRLRAVASRGAERGSRTLHSILQPKVPRRPRSPSPPPTTPPRRPLAFALLLFLSPSLLFARGVPGRPLVSFF